MNILAGTSLGDYGHPVFKRDGFVCVYCGFDGNGFNNWRQLSVDHLRPRRIGGTDSEDNLLTACHFCNSSTSLMTFSPDQSASEVLKLKKEYVARRLKALYQFWSREVAPTDDALTPLQGSAYLPHPLVLDFRAFEMTDEQLLRLSADNDALRFELTAKGELVIMPPAASLTGWQGARLLQRLANWAEQEGTGMVFNSSAGFRLPNGAVRAPDASWLLRLRWDALSEDEREKFAHICSDFVIVLRSPSDTLSQVQAKMAEYIENGARLGWLVDPQQRRVYVYTPDQPVSCLDEPGVISGDPVLHGFRLDLREIW